LSNSSPSSSLSSSSSTFSIVIFRFLIVENSVQTLAQFSRSTSILVATIGPPSS